ncbi:myxococcus cysteine-rich repeat protein (macronuclear) [Tetrahymena thermophila SB210]|uniref:Myxococcus cysteine-rich repeat protein n=1 Tax=Tetrahymena thermophila (strain SB210) TaxID=312017 RepID=Q241N0_TETTS|nr:myxococcus cysteine-rich repeat protein [Tetrahymena thermophila SB210]EAS02540.2 myxococcus cysteine-rich repeat protein [Tetrahymena thermophila SB210]|eukprot:XP_001022785.2 myxococcus cysteine-rich repeat protein [Tetrahymena thermophila SB210]
MTRKQKQIMNRFKIILVIFLFNLRIQSTTCDIQVYKRADDTAFPLSSWKYPNTKMVCNQRDSEFNQVMLGNYQLSRGSIANTLNVSNLPPHFQINFRVDLYIINTWDTETVSVIVNSQKQPLSVMTYDHNKARIKWQKVCVQGQLINYMQRNEYTLADANSNLSIDFKTNCDRNPLGLINNGSGCEDISNESFSIGQVQVFVDECHFSCLSCVGPQQNQCKLCFNNVIPTNGVCPQCVGASSIFDNGICVSSCPQNKINKNQVCVLRDQFCLVYQQNGYDCQQCQPNYFVWNGICVDKCPLFYDQNNNICQDMIRSLPSGFVALEGLQIQRFSSLHIKQLGFSIQNLNSNNNGFFFLGLNTMYTICGDIQLLGGFRSDYSQKNPISNIIVNLNGVSVQLASNQYIKKTSFNLCGFEQNDAYGEFNYVLADSATTDLSVIIDNQSNFDLGIRDFIVGGYSCANTCESCHAENPSLCLSCYNGFYLLNNKCVTECPSEQYQDQINKQCVSCSSTYPNCKICNQNSCLLCQNSYYFSPTNNCVTCSQTPIKQYWNPISMQCTDTCDSGLQADDQNQVCRNQCKDQGCLICNQASQNICQQCFSGYYLYNGSCVQSCPQGTSLDNSRVQCLSCIDPLCYTCNFDINNIPNCQQCVSGKYLDATNICQPCDQSCQTCNGGQPNQCLSCNSQDSNIVLNSDNTCTCKSVYYSFESSTQRCKPICGDKFKTPEEECETFDSSFENVFGCDSNCKIVSGYKCFHQDPYILDICISSLCGDGKVDPSEQCDDGNNINGDGCSLDCKQETGFNCQVQSGKSTCSSICGDNLVSQDEECDSNDVGCDQLNCKIKTNFGCSFTKYNEYLQTSNCFQCDDPFCMKCSKIDPIQQICLLCKENYFYDTNLKKCLACDQSCQTCFGSSPNQCKSCFDHKDQRVILDQNSNTCVCNSQYYKYDANQQICSPICHDMYKAPEEECEIQDPSLFENSKCVNCKIQSGYKCFSSKEFDLDICTTLKCGDGIRDQDEECDDGNQINSDACSLNCKIQKGYSCIQDIGSSKFKCQSTCGDRIKSNDEECDSADVGCSSDCKIISNYGCYLENSLATNLEVEKCFKCQDINCLRCTKTYNSVYSTYDETCSQCQDGFYMNNNSNKCEKCHFSCKTCSGPTANNCSSCYKNSNVVLNITSKQCTCQNNYYSYDITTNQCIPVCGDNHKTPEEECEINDLTAFSNSQGCVQCKVQPGYKCIHVDNIQLDVCMLSTCQNGILDSGEECDDGNLIQLDKCSLDCKVNKGYQCSQSLSQSDLKCEEKCGDNIATPSEECDPPGIGCSNNCQIMPGYGCQQVKGQNNMINFQPTQCFKCQSANCNRCEIVNNVEICKICENNYFLDTQSNQCQNCHSSCNTCKGPQAVDCLSCPDDKFILLVNGSCQKCDKLIGLYFDSQTQKCQELCGKGYMLTDKHLKLYGINKTIECDDSNIQDNDGCSQNCKIEHGFKCVNPLIKDENLISQSLCTTLTDGPTPFLKLEAQYTSQKNYYQIRGEIYFDRQISISSTQNIISYLDVENSLDYDIKIFKENLVLNTLMIQNIELQIRVYKPLNNITVFLKFKQSDITDKFNSSLLKKSISSQLPHIDLLAQDIYGNNAFTITFLNSFLGFLSYFMLFFVPFNIIVTLFDLLQSVNYLKFLNVNYPKELYVFLNLFNFANFEFFPNVSAKNAAVPLTFQREQVDSFLFSNLIQTVIIWNNQIC